MDETTEKQNSFVSWIERLNGGAISRISDEGLHTVIKHLVSESAFIYDDISPSTKIIRGRILSKDEKLTSIDQLGPPPKEKCRIGRCNTHGDPIVYAGVGHELVFSEIGARQGDIVGLLYMSPTQPLQVMRVGALDLWRRTNGHCLLTENVKQQIAAAHQDPANIIAFLVDAFIRDYFSRKSDESVYKITSAYTKITLEAHPQMAGVMYDSVDHTAGSCVAIQTESYKNNFAPTDVQLVRITSHLGYGIYDFEELARASRFDEHTIIWNE